MEFSHKNERMVVLCGRSVQKTAAKPGSIPNQPLQGSTGVLLLYTPWTWSENLRKQLAELIVLVSKLIKVSILTTLCVLLKSNCQLRYYLKRWIQSL